MQNTEHTTEEVTTETAASRPNLFGRKRTKALLGLALFLAAILASGVTRSGNGQVEVGSMASADINSPALQAKVWKQAMPIYHWHEDCPLASAKSLRPEGARAPMKREVMTRQQAEKHHLMVCTYCSDMDSK